MRRDPATITATPRGLMSWSFDLTRDGTPLTTLETSWFRERGSFELGGETYDIEKDSPLAGRIHLVHDGHSLAMAKPSFWVNAAAIQVEGDHYRLTHESCCTRGLVLTLGGRRVGHITPIAPLTRRCHARLPGELSVPVQVFILWLGTMIWRRDASDAA
ncbi:MAG: hypothetical protein ACF8Q5_13315 [Phycisphaerales bacterium JB040]